MLYRALLSPVILGGVSVSSRRVLCLFRVVLFMFAVVVAVVVVVVVVAAAAAVVVVDAYPARGLSFFP